MDFRVVLVITPIVFSWIFTVFWLGRWDVFRLTPLGLPKKGVAPFKNLFDNYSALLKLIID